MPTRLCKDCEPGSTRPTPHPGPRCVTHHRVFKKAQKARTHDQYVQRTYGLRPGVYARLWLFQGGKCYICQKATGAARKLAVDHDHTCCPGPVSCGECVRGLLCGPCNKDVIGRLGAAALQRAIDYLQSPPARRLLGGVT